MSISPLAPAIIPSLPAIAGVRLSAVNCGIRYKHKPDLLLVQLAQGTAVAGVLTRSLTASAPVLRCREYLKYEAARALVVNSGNSNAFTGKAGEQAVDAVEQSISALFGCARSACFMASTGVIGEPLPVEKITSALPALADQLNDNDWLEATRAIMTTDTFPKLATRTAVIAGTKVTLNGIAKGSGMIAPDMATMLAFVFTDAAIPASALQSMLESANAKSFNSITVDGDTSTSDTALLFATGKAGNPAGDYSAFADALDSLMIELAQLIIRDGEGATKFVTIEVTGAEHDAAARNIALSIANSPLVKTALAAGDANWGRIVAAVGKAGERADRDKLTLHIKDVLVACDGAVAPGYHEEQIADYMKGAEIEMAVDVGIGSGKTRIWTCDLTHGYIDINASYRS